MDGDTKAAAVTKQCKRLALVGRLGRGHLQFSKIPHGVLGEADVGLELQGTTPPSFPGKDSF